MNNYELRAEGGLGSYVSFYGRYPVWPMSTKLWHNSELTTARTDISKFKNRSFSRPIEISSLRRGARDKIIRPDFVLFYWRSDTLRFIN